MSINKRRSLTVEEKQTLINEMAGGASNTNLRKKYGLSSSTISTIWKNRDKLEKNINPNTCKLKRIRKPRKQEIDQALLAWCKEQASQNLPLSLPILQEKARALSKVLDLNDSEAASCSKTWLIRFRKRHNISQLSAGVTSRAETPIDWLEDVWPKIRRDYSNNDIFNADETGLFYKLTPSEAVKLTETEHARMTVLVCANMSGTEKRQLHVIAKSKSIGETFGSSTVSPVKYSANKNSWMTSKIFSEELQSWNEDLQKQKRKIILLIDDCSVHSVMETFQSIKLIFLPSAIPQPMEPIIVCLKQHYKRLFLSQMKFGTTEFSLLDAIMALNTAWKRVSQDTIVTCYRQAGFYSAAVELDGNQDISWAQRLLDTTEEDTLTLKEWATEKHLDSTFSSEELEAFANVDNRLVTNSSNGDDGVDEFIPEQIEEVVKLPTHQEVFNAINTISTYLQFSDFDCHIRNQFDQIQRCVEECLFSKNVNLS